MRLFNNILVASAVTTDIFDPGGLSRTFLVVLVIVVEFYLLRRQIMATKEELAQAISDVTTATAGEIERVTKKIEDLTGLASAANDGVSPADLDQPVAQLKALASALNGVVVDPVTSAVTGTESLPSESTSA